MGGPAAHVAAPPPRARRGWRPTLGSLSLCLLLGLLCADGCRRDIELSLPPHDPAVGCTANGEACAGDGTCCSRLCIGGSCVLPAACGHEGDPCSEAGQCCSLVCGHDPAGTGALVCQNADGCASEGQPCGRADACCSLGCASTSEGMVPVCTSITCRVAGEACAAARDCCNGACVGGKCAAAMAFPPGSCRSAGELCATDQECCGSVCLPAASPPGVSQGRCGLLPFCRVTGETCTAAGDCCSGICVNAPNLGVMLCSDGRECRVGLDRCADDAECCSGQCDFVPGGGARCRFLSGCRPTGERCATAANCCSRSCVAGSDNVFRCGASTPACRPLGELCQTDGDCCGHEKNSCRATVGEGATTPSTSKRCLGAEITSNTCFGAGETCVHSDQCCGAGNCVPQGSDLFSCHPSCSPRGAPCAADQDCCPGGLCVGPPGRTACLSLNGVDSAGVCTRAGERCDPRDDSCCLGTHCGKSTGDGPSVCGW